LQQFPGRGAEERDDPKKEQVKKGEKKWIRIKSKCLNVTI
jgi:hypothetical protein